MRTLVSTSFVILALLLGACATLQGGLTPEQAMAVACRGYSGTLGALGPWRSMANETQVKTVQTVVRIISPLCRKAARRELVGDAWLIALNEVRAQLRILLELEISLKEQRT